MLSDCSIPCVEIIESFIFTLYRMLYFRTCSGDFPMIQRIDGKIVQSSDSEFVYVKREKLFKRKYRSINDVYTEG